MFPFCKMGKAQRNFLANTIFLRIVLKSRIAGETLAIILLRVMFPPK